jgi:hypothetical protein
VGYVFTDTAGAIHKVFRLNDLFWGIDRSIKTSTFGMTQKKGTVVSATVGPDIFILCSTFCTDERVESDKGHHKKGRK